jgi:hypothetical protein
VILICVAEINKLSLINISQNYLQNGGVDASYFQHIGSAIQAENYWGDTAGLVYNLVFIIGALMLYAVFYQSKLIPRWISMWGVLAAVTLFIGAMLSIFIDISPAIAVVLIAPIGVQEMVMAVWLIVKGFNASAIAPASVKTDRHEKA